MKHNIPRWLGSLMAGALLLGFAPFSAAPVEKALATTTDWTAQLTISAQDGSIPQTLTIGTSTDGIDLYYGGEDLLAPPSPPADSSTNTSVVSLGVYHSTADGFPLTGMYVKDIRAPVNGSQAKTWTPIYATTATDTTNGNQLTLSWTLSGVPDNVQLKLQEISGGAVTDTNGDGVSSYDMKQASSYSYKQNASYVSQTLQFQIVATNTTPTIGLVGSVTQSNLTSDGVTLSYSTDKTSSAKADVSTADGTFVKTFTDTNVATQHTLVLSGLNPNTSYVAALTSTSPDSSIDPLVISNITFKTAIPTIILSGISVTPTTTDATITWKTDLASTSHIDYGTTVSYGQSAGDDNLVTVHSVKLPNLTSDTTYHFQITSAITASGAKIQSADQTFKTNALAINITKAPAVSAIGANTATIAWTTDVASDSTVSYGTTVTYDQAKNVPDLVTAHSVVLTGLKPNTTYHYQAISAATGRPSATSTDATFQTKTGQITLTVTPVISGRTGSSATIYWETSVPTDTVLQYGVGTALNLSQTGTSAVTQHSIALTGLNPNTSYSFQVVANATGYDKFTSQTFTFKTLAQNQDFVFIDSYGVMDIANDNTGQVQNQTSTLYGATTGAERDVAYDAKRGIAYIARGTLTTEDGRATGQYGVAAIKLTPIQASVNPNVPDAITNYTDTGLITAPSESDGSPGLGFVQSLYFDSVSDALYVFSGTPNGGPSKTPRVYSAPGGTVGGSPNGGDTSKANQALVKLFDMDEPSDSSGQALGGNNRGIAVRTANSITTIYLSMAEHADVWSNKSGSWSRAWSSNLFPADNDAGTPLILSDTAVRSVAVDDAGYSYWPVSAPASAPRIWVFPPDARGQGVGFSDKAFNGSHDGSGHPLIIDNDSTVIPTSNFAFPVNVEYYKSGSLSTLFVSLLGSDQQTPSVSWIKLTSDPSSAGNSISGRLTEGFGPGATGSVQDAILKSMAIKGASGVTQPAAPPASAKLLYFAVSPTENALYLNTYLKNDQMGQSIPTSAVAKVTFGALPQRPFLSSRPQATVSGTTVTIKWSTDIATTDNRVEYGADATYGQTASETVTDGGTQNHTVTLSGLKSASTYHYHVISAGTGLETVTSSDDTFVTGSSVMLGDLNGDGKINVSDATISLRIAVGLVTPTADQKTAGDVNKDGKLSVADTTLILQVAVGLKTGF